MNGLVTKESLHILHTPAILVIFEIKIKITKLLLADFELDIKRPDDSS